MWVDILSVIQIIMLTIVLVKAFEHRRAKLPNVHSTASSGLLLVAGENSLATCKNLEED